MQRRWWVIVAVFVWLAVTASLSQAHDLTASSVDAPQATCTWNNTAGNWNDSTKWNCGVVPGAADTAIVNGGTITLTADVTVNTLTFAGGTIQGNSNFAATDVTWTGGTFAGSGTTTVNGTLDMSNSSVSLDTRTFNNAGSATFGGSSSYITIFNGAVFNNQTGASLQIATTSSSQVTYSTGGGTFNNSGFITKTFASPGFAYIYATFHNSGSVVVTNGTFQMNPASNATDTNNGTLRVNTGATIQFSSGTFNVDGVITGTGTMQFSGGTINYNTGTYSVTNTTANGGVTLFAPVTSFSSANTTVSGGTLNLSTGNPINFNSLTLSGGTLTGQDNFTIGTMTWSGGTLSGASTNATVTGSLDMSNSSVTLDGRTLNNAGAATMGGSSAYMILYNGAVFNNQSGASLQLTHTGTGQITYSTGGGTFNNSGVITKTASSNGTTYFYLPFNNSGAVTVNGGTLQVNSPSSTTSNNSGTFHVSSGMTLQYAGSGIVNFTGIFTGTGTAQWTGGTLNFNSGTYNVSNTKVDGGSMSFASGTSFSSPNTTISFGSLTLSTGNPINFSSLTLSGGTLTGQDNFTIGTMAWSGGTLSGASTNATVTGSLDMSNSSVTLDGRTLNNAGAATMGGSSAYMILYNGAVFNNQSGASLQLTHTGTGQITYSTGGGTFNNSGVITKPLTSNGGTYIYATFNNTGTLTINGGTMYLASNTGTPNNDSGPIRVASGAAVQFSGSGTQNFNAGSSLVGAGSVSLQSTNVNFNAGSTYVISSTQINGGTADFTNASAVTFDDLTLSFGTLRVGDVSVTGDFTSTFGTFTAISGTVTFKGGTTQNLTLSSSTTFDNLAVTSGTTLVDAADANYATVSGVLTNNGIIRKTRSIPSVNVYSFGLTGATISVTVKGTLASATIDLVGHTHPFATGTIAPGRYWTITPSGGGYTVALTLSHNLAEPDQAKVCHFDTGSHTWVCDKTSFTTNTVTLAGLTDLVGDWAIGGAARKIYLPLIMD